MPEYAPIIAHELQIQVPQVAAALELLAAGNTVPFIARYRKEATDSLDEEQLRLVTEWEARLRALDERRQTILKTVAEQGALTDELRRAILAAGTLTQLEDLYQPFKPKRRTRASEARERGLEPLAQMILAQEALSADKAALAKPFISDDVATVEAALSGARDIVAEMVSEQATLRQAVREKAQHWGVLQVQKVEKATDDKRLYELYYDLQARVSALKPHQVLAINRAEEEKILRVRLHVAERDSLAPAQAMFPAHRRSPFYEDLQSAVEDGVQRLLLPAIERDVRRALTEAAQAHAITLFARNLRGLLLQPPLAGHVILAIDPAYRTGCKVAVIDPTGKVLETAAVYPHQPQRREQEALRDLAHLVTKHGVSLIAIGNGTASRETERLVAELISSRDALHYLIVNEAGASVYSASPLARAELPELDVSLRGAVSIGRRVLDPLAELVKIDPQAIGVGLYQHDVNQKQLAAALAEVVESVVNQVGVEVNTASVALLTYVSGIGPRLAEQIVAHRDQNGPFPDRQALLDVKGLGQKAFEQSAGFLRIRDGLNPLDASAIHPESYAVAATLLGRVGLTPETSPAERQPALAALQPTAGLAQELGTGLPTLVDIFDQLIRPGRDPRQEMPAPVLRSDVLTMADLRPGMALKGTVRNVVDFGAFVDIGVKQDGLLHRSQIPRQARLAVGQVIEVTIRSVEEERGRISLGWTGPAAG